MKTDKATARPWDIKSSKHSKHKEAMFLVSNGKWVGKTYGHENENAFENARLIVRAVNSHDALVEALELAKDEIARMSDDQYSYTDEELGDIARVDETVYLKISNALKLAKGE